MKNRVKVIGGGLAGCECALYLADHDVEVTLAEMKPLKFSPAHKSADFCELVCSNSLKSDDVYGNAAGLLKQEMRILGSKVIAAADKTKVPAGNALAVNREAFSRAVTEEIKSRKNIKVVAEEVLKINKDEYTVVATGPLTSDALSEDIKNLTGGYLSFFDASAPIIFADSIDMENAFWGDRYGKGNGDHLNLPLNKEEYEEFIKELLSAKKAPLKEFENSAVFEGCMPIEVMAARGKNTLRFGPMKPTGLDDPKTGRWPYALIQLRREDSAGTMFNMVGFQTNLLFGEQKRVFSIVPALKNAEYARYGVMHRNTFIDSPKLLNKDFSLKSYPKVHFCGQITGVEGYVESAATGLLTAIYLTEKLSGKNPEIISEKTVSGALTKYITTPNKDFQPMNANFGILPAPAGIIRDKALKKRTQAENSLEEVENFKRSIEL